MTSQQVLINKLREIANNHNLVGEGVDAQIGWLSFLFSNYSTEVVNAMNEINLATATLMNNKITQCMNVMYSVYRGRNAVLKLNNYTLYSDFNVNKYQLIYTSNNFFIYANKSYSYNRVIDQPMEFIISKKPKYEIDTLITTDNKDYIDIKLNDIVIGELSEDIKISIKGKSDNEFTEVSSTRLFYEHIHQQSELTKSQILGQYLANELNVDTVSKLFVLTIPDFGIRLFKKGGFEVDSTVKIECFSYTTKEELSKYGSEISRIKFENFDMTVDLDVSTFTEVDQNGNSVTRYNNFIEVESPRDNINTSFYNAIAYSHLQSQIMTNIDVDVLFTEFFRDYIQSAAHICTKVGDKFVIYIYYVPIGNNVITEKMMQAFRDSYGSYYLGSIEMFAILATKRELTVNIELYVTESKSLNEYITSIFSNYSNKLPYLTKFKYNAFGGVDVSGNQTEVYTMLESANILSNNIKRIRAQITNLPSVYYIDKFNIIDSDIPDLLGDDRDLPRYSVKAADANIVANSDSELNMEVGVTQIPSYYNFKLNLIYNYNEDISR